MGRNEAMEEERRILRVGEKEVDLRHTKRAVCIEGRFGSRKAWVTAFELENRIA